MSGYTDACRIEAEGIPDLVSFLEQQSDSGRFVLTAKGRLSEKLQKSVGDAIANVNSQVISVEFKNEVKWTGNLFLETWSNRSRRTTGWMVKLDADILLYRFEDKRVLYSIPFQRLCRWAFVGNIYRFPEKKQKKHDQLNDTWGRCVPVETVKREVGFREWTFDSSAGQWID